MDGLADKVVIIPGGATKIGAAVATAFVLSGAKVVIADINIDGGEAAAATHDDSAIFTKTDISSDEEIENLPGIAVAGSAYRGVGIPDCAASAGEAASCLLGYIAARVS